MYLLYALTKTYLAAPFPTISAANLKAISHMAEIFKQKMDPTKLIRNEAPNPRAEAIPERADNNPPNTYIDLRVTIPSNPLTSAPMKRTTQRPKSPNPIVEFEDNEYTLPRVETDPFHRGAPFYNKQHQKWIKMYTSNWEVKEKLFPYLSRRGKVHSMTQNDYLTRAANSIIDEDM